MVANYLNLVLLLFALKTMFSTVEVKILSMSTLQNQPIVLWPQPLLRAPSPRVRFRSREPKNPRSSRSPKDHIIETHSIPETQEGEKEAKEDVEGVLDNTLTENMDTSAVFGGSALDRARFPRISELEEQERAIAEKIIEDENKTENYSVSMPEQSLQEFWTTKSKLEPA